MFTPGLIIGVPYFANAQGRPQVIQVPVRSAGSVDMVINAGFQTAGAESTADICIIAGFDKEGPKFADLDWFFDR